MIADKGRARLSPILRTPMRKFLSRLIGTSEESDLRPLQPLVDRINELEAHYQDLSDEQIRHRNAKRLLPPV